MMIISKQIDGSSKFLGVGSLFSGPEWYPRKENTVEIFARKRTFNESVESLRIFFYCKWKTAMISLIFFSFSLIPKSNQQQTKYSQPIFNNADPK